MNNNKGKKVKVEKMFNDIAHKYDFLNHFLSMGIDILWRRTLRKALAPSKPKKILDVATGTGDLAIELAKLNPESIIGVDIAEEMLNIGKAKLSKKKLDHIIKLEVGDSEKLLFHDNSFDAVTVSFGVRNYENLQKGLLDMNRVLKPGGMVAILEFSKPKKFPFRNLYNFYFKYILPLFGKIVSSHDSAYTYLPESVQGFAEDKEFLGEMKKANYKKCKQKRLTFGIATLYTGVAN
ncbi:MAG: bifunctional demethylmenaquinone methyltransferase/2-methoxy-6-polyprenyl-1,4-benzoquinol methylase UbiE [Chlorobi bacterium]|nr:bifunctional demethylmenaquinone methyltransferase/2-methoxy-6-polyprenyl-1,4-benzoquinol methylase UbiE [Chlorobiota bacterium]